MASKTITTLYDDIDHSTEDVRTVTLAFDGQAVEVDLGRKNYEKLAKAVSTYLAAGRRVNGGERSTTARKAIAKTSDPSVIRAWAEANGIAVSSRGRISAVVREQYESAN